MEQERSRNIAVGLTTMGGLVGLLSLLFLFGYVPTLLQSGYLVSIRYSHASGLHPGSRVHLNGIDIGKVESIKLDAPAGAGVTVIARVQDEIALPVGVVASVQTQILGGSSTVELLVEDGAMFEAGLLPADGSGVIQGETGSIATQFEVMTQNFGRLADSFTALSEEWQLVAVNLQGLTEPRDPAEVDAGSTTANLASALTRADARLAEMRQTIEYINAWTGDEALREDFKTAVARTSQASAQMDAAIPRVEKRMIALADDLSKVASSMETVLQQAQAGEGTVGKMLNDPALYDNLNDSAQRLQKVLDETRLLIEKWKAEGVPVQF